MQKLKTIGAVHTHTHTHSLSLHLQNAKCIGEKQKYNLIETIKEAINASNCDIKIKQAIIV